MFYAVLFDHLEGKPCRISDGRLKPTDTLYQFRLYDGDDNLMFTGVSTLCDSEEAFYPLDDLQNNYGVTRIDYFNQGKGIWETL